MAARWSRGRLGLWLAMVALGAAGCGDSTTGDTSTTSSATSDGGAGGGGDGGSGAGTSAGGTGGSGASTGAGGTGGSTATSGGGTGGTGGGTATGGAGGMAACVSSAECDNGLYCDGVEACVGGVCLPGSSPCDDGIYCTKDACDEAVDSCTHMTDNALCDDGLMCTGTEICHALLGCLSIVVPDCSDAFSCTDDFCDTATDSCAHVPNDGKCNNGVFCDGAEQCDPMVGAPITGCAEGVPVNCADGIPCTVDSCNEALDTCNHVASSAMCSDGLFCNGVEVCTPGIGCQAGLPPNCNDNRSCTADGCDNATAACTHTPNHAACSDGLDCNGQETCSAGGPVGTGCLVGTPIPCPPDSVSCTIDACNEATNQCEHTASNAQCPSGQFCVPAAGGCTAAMPCLNDAQCNDGNACNGVETCNGVVCQPGQAVNCDDGIPCTIDSCNAVTGTCSHAPNDAFCDDGSGCTGVETCNAATGCVPGTFIDCDDGVACTFDVCNDPAGICTHFANDGDCNDGQLCNGVEVCNPAIGCVAGTPYTCPSDGIACTVETCDPMTNGCTTETDDSLCPCGQTCSPTQGCGSFCTISTCQGKVYECGDCLDNDGDCQIDSGDTQCLGPCDNTEDGFYGGIPGQNNSPCKSDCYFDQDTGSGNDDCYWSHKCDPLSVPPDYPPEGSQCEYNPNASIPGYSGTCSQAFATQSQSCFDYCGPLTPNGCDCFGCCEIPGAPTTVWLGSENPPGTGSCNIMTLNDPSLCKPCTQVQACINTCEVCEICIGKPTLPPGCNGQECPIGAPACGQPGQAPCSPGFTCITGCCQPNPTLTETPSQ